MEIKFLGATREVTGSCFSISTGSDKILIDCGMFQGGKEMEKMNYDDFNFNPAEYSALLLTHAHLDHCGRIPKLTKYGFRGKIVTTQPTAELASIIMLDSAKIAREDTKNENERRAEEGLPPRKPLYSDSDVKVAMKLFAPVKYGADVAITKNIRAKFYDAGHILGSACIQLTIKEKGKNTIVVFSGDLGHAQSVLVKDPQTIENADYVVVESTYGDRLHPPVEERTHELLKIILETYQKGGKLLIPSFAVERAQEIIYLIGEFTRAGLMPRMSVFLDSPMAERATDVFNKFPEYYNAHVQADLKKNKELFTFPGFIRTMSVQESMEINHMQGPCIIIAGNGMCTAGRIKHHIKHNIDNPRNTILLVGYQVEGTLGYHIKNKEKKIKLLGTEMDVRARVEAIDGFSAHADYLGTIAWLKNFSPKPKKVFIVHGDEKQGLAFSKRLAKEGFNAIMPSFLDTITL